MLVCLGDFAVGRLGCTSGLDYCFGCLDPLIVLVFCGSFLLKCSDVGGLLGCYVFF